MNKNDGSGKLWSDQSVNGMGGPGAQQGTDSILIQDNETKQNRMYGYIIMASSVVVLAILMVRLFSFSIYLIDFTSEEYSLIIIQCPNDSVFIFYRYSQYSAATAQTRP